MNLARPQPVTLLRNNATLGIYQAERWPDDTSGAWGVGHDVGFLMQRKERAMFLQPAPDVQPGDVLQFLDHTFFAAGTNIYDTTLEVLIWRPIYNLTVNILDAGGNVLVSGWPAILRPANVEQTGAGQQELQTSVDATLYCPVSDLIHEGDGIKVLTSNGVAASKQQARMYAVKWRDDEFLQGAILCCGLRRK